MSKKPILIISCLIVLLVSLSFLLLSDTVPEADVPQELEVLCAAGLRRPVEEVARKYEAEYGVKINLNYGGSGQLYGTMKLRGGDLYIPADISYIDDAKKAGLVAESIPLSHLTAGIIVPKGNPKNIKTLADLQRDDVSLAIASETAAVGKFTHKVLRQAKLLDGISSGEVNKFPTVNEVAVQVKLRAADAGIVWDALMPQYKNCEFIRVAEFNVKRKTANVGVIRTTNNPTGALKFARYLTSKKGAEVFKKKGFDVVSENFAEWKERPKVVLYAGSMLRPAIQDQLKQFENREGCEVIVKYDGCGVLVSAMKSGETPGAFFSCDVSFMEQVQEKFHASVVVAANDIVILVPKGNPRNIQSLDDLVGQKLKLGIADQNKSALGKLTYQMLANQQLLENLIASGNIVTTVAKGDDLVNQMQTNALDVALLYRSNAMASSGIMKHCEIVGVEAGKAYAHQPFAIAKDSRNSRLLVRLGEFLTSEESKESFLKYGFYWEFDQSVSE